MGWFKEGFLAGFLGTDGYMSYKTRQAVLEQTAYQMERDRLDRQGLLLERHQQHFSTRLAPLMPQVDIGVSHVTEAFNARDAVRVRSALHDLALVASPAAAVVDALIEEAMQVPVPAEWWSSLLSLKSAYRNWVFVDEMWSNRPGVPPESVRNLVVDALGTWNQLADTLELVAAGG